MNAEIVCVGSELLTGAVTDTNGGHIARRLIAAGIEPVLRVTVGDELDRIVQALGDASRRAGLVIVSGGLGPTHDDLTREALAAATGRELELSAELEAGVKAFFEARGKTMSPANLSQAFLPRGGRAIANPLGTAPGIELEHEGTRIFALPGVPGEMEAMLAQRVIPSIAGAPGVREVSSRTLRVAGIGESDLAQLIADVVDGCRASGGPVVSILASGGQVAVNLRAPAASAQTAAGQIRPVEVELRRRLGRDLFGADEQTLESVVVEAAARRGLTVSVAESFTGGLLASRLVSVPGSSDVFHTGFVTYARAAKVRQLHLSPDLLERYGAVSGEAAAAMALGAREASGASIGLSTTGEAGPEPQEKPVGTMFVGLSWDGGSLVRNLVASGGRGEIRSTGTTVALDVLRRWLAGDGNGDDR